MLHLKVKPGMGISVGDDVVILFLRYSEGQMSLGIKAPAEKKVARAGPFTAEQLAEKVRRLK